MDSDGSARFYNRRGSQGGRLIDAVLDEGGGEGPLGETPRRE
jgi:hypothetical protein